MNFPRHRGSLAISAAMLAAAPSFAMPPLRTQRREPMTRGGLIYQVRHTDAEGRELSAPMLGSNLVPTEGLNHMLDVVLHGAAQIPTWYLALFEGNYTPTFDITAATFPQLATECTTVQGTTRLEYKEAAAVAGATSNAASLAVFTSTADRTIYGAALLSSSGKGSTVGKILSCFRFPEPRNFAVGNQLAVLTPASLANV